MSVYYWPPTTIERQQANAKERAASNWENGGRQLARCNAPAQMQMRARLRHQLQAIKDPDSWHAISLKKILSMPEWKASVLAAEAETDAVQWGNGGGAKAADASSFRERNKRGFVVSCLQSRAETSSDRTTALKLAKHEHITSDSAKKRTTGAVPTEAGVAPVVNVAAVGAPAAPPRHHDDFEIFRDGGPTRPLAASATGRASTTTRRMTPREIARREKRSRFFHDDFLAEELKKRGGIVKLLQEVAIQAYGDARHSLGLGYDQPVWLR